jgi:1-deoxy-D-xylulose-5-phosphate reductoisomerase
MNRLAILGSTGSIGTQTLEVVREHRDRFAVELLVAGSNSALLIEQAREFSPNAVVIGDERKLDEVRDALFPLGIKVYAGAAAIEQCMVMEGIDTVLTAMVGYAGLRPTIAAIKAGKTIALANKETLVVAGELITTLAREHRVNIYPVDSEHSAIFQCLAGEWENPIEEIVLTASGGPFRGKSRTELAQVTRAQALKHPNWEMGAKITIDSASLMNKGLELIEAYHLFPVEAAQLDCVVHPQSIVHCLVTYRDGSVLAQLSCPDMRTPIALSLAWPRRMQAPTDRLDLVKASPLTFEAPDETRFPALKVAKEALARGGAAPAVLNAANEIAVAAFLQKRIGFLEIARVVRETLELADARGLLASCSQLSDVLAVDAEGRRLAETRLDA